jgi:hypothetical protein
MSEAYEIFQKRIKSQRSINKDKMIEDKLRDFIVGLDKSFNSEEVEVNGVKTKAIINRVESTPELRTKNFSALKDYFKIGSVFKWIRDNSYWMIVERNENELAYFNGLIKEAPYIVTWRNNETGISYTSRAAVKGPEETALKTIYKKGITVNEGNLTLSFALPNDIEGISFLKRYSEVFVDGEKWSVVAMDRFTSKDLVTFDVVETAINRDADDLENSIPNGKETITFTHSSAISGIDETQIGFLLGNLSPVLFKNGIPENGALPEVKFVNCVQSLDGVIFDSVGQAKIVYYYEDIDKKFTYLVNVVSNSAISSKVFYIEGPSKIASYLDCMYKVHLKENGLILPTNGNWLFDINYFDSVSFNGSEILLKAKGKLGKTTVLYEENGENCYIDIKIVPIFEI